MINSVTKRIGNFIYLSSLLVLIFNFLDTSILKGGSKSPINGACGGYLEAPKGYMKLLTADIAQKEGISVRELNRYLKTMNKYGSFTIADMACDQLTDKLFKNLERTFYLIIAILVLRFFITGKIGFYWPFPKWPDQIDPKIMPRIITGFFVFYIIVTFLLINDTDYGLIAAAHR
tara:strand:+ start:55 stop:579 length:525 start_codon:yes stop_codon:yes gene_type:complete